MKNETNFTANGILFTEKTSVKKRRKRVIQFKILQKSHNTKNQLENRNTYDFDKEF